MSGGLAAVKINAPHREKNGRLRRPTLAQQKAAQQAIFDMEKSVCLKQPHRNGSKSELRENALGRFVEDHKIELVGYEAGLKYRALVSRWRALNDITNGRYIREGDGVAEEPTREDMDKLSRRIKDAENCMARYGKIGFVVTRDLCLDDVEPHPLHILAVKIALMALALEFGLEV